MTRHSFLEKKRAIRAWWGKVGWREKLYGNLIEGWLRVGIDLAVRFVELVFGLFFFLSRRRMQKIDWVWILCSVLIVIYSFHGPQWQSDIIQQFDYPLVLTPDSYVVPPILEDLTGDDVDEIVAVTEESRLLVLQIDEKSVVRNSVSLQKTGFMERKSTKVVGLGAGKIQKNEKVIVVVLESGVVFCFDPKLRMLWEVSLLEEESQDQKFEKILIGFTIESLQLGDQGGVIIGGKYQEQEQKPSQFVHNHDDSLELSLREKEKKLGINIPTILHELPEQQTHTSHYNYYAFEGKTGGKRWVHEEDDFLTPDQHKNEENFEQHLPTHIHKLHVASQSHRKHDGQAQWYQYRESVRSHLPHHVTTTAFGDSANLKISHFSRSLNLKHKEKKEEGEGEKEEMKGNVVVAHLGGGMEVLHLFSGRTLCYVPFSPDTIYLDGDEDGVVEGVRTVISYSHFTPDSTSTYDPVTRTTKVTVHSTSRGAGRTVEGDCYAECFSGSEQLWNVSVCNAFNKGKLALVADADFGYQHFKSAAMPTTKIRTEMEVVSKAIPQKWRTGGNGERYDYIFLTSSGDAVSVQWDGNINWYAHTAASWTATPLSNNEQPNVWSFGSEKTKPRGKGVIVPLEGTGHIALLGECISLVSLTTGIVAQEECFPSISGSPSSVLVGKLNGDSINLVIYDQGKILGFMIRVGWEGETVVIFAFALLLVSLSFVLGFLHVFLPPLPTKSK